MENQYEARLFSYWYRSIGSTITNVFLPCQLNIIRTGNRLFAIQYKSRENS